MLSADALREVVARLPLISADGPWSRAVGSHVLFSPPPGAAPLSPPQPLWGGGAALHGARFTPKGSFPSLYLASDPVTALKEVRTLFPGVTVASHPWTLLTVTGYLEQVLDLADESVQSALGTSRDELAAPWRYEQGLHADGQGPLPPTQLSGRELHASGRVTALRYHAVKNWGEGTGFVVFPDRLTPQSHLEIHDPYGFFQQKLTHA